MFWKKNDDGSWVGEQEDQGIDYQLEFSENVEGSRRAWVEVGLMGRERWRESWNEAEAQVEVELMKDQRQASGLTGTEDLVGLGLIESRGLELEGLVDGWKLEIQNKNPCLTVQDQNGGVWEKVENDLRKD